MEVVIQELIKFLSKNGVAVTNIFLDFDNYYRD